MRLTMPNKTTAAANADLGRVLVCDDDRVSGRRVAALLAAAGYNCELVATHAEARLRLARGAVDVVTSDIASDVEFEFVRSVAQAPAAPAVLVLTDTPSVIAAQRALRSHAVDYIVMPDGEPTLVAAVAAATAAHRARLTLQQQRERCERSVRDMMSCERLVGDGRTDGQAGAADTFVNLAIGQAVDAIGMLGDFARLMAAPTRAELAQRLRDARPLQLVDAIRETILVLEHTKSSFRSRELADLRKKLEALMRVDGDGGSARIDATR